MVVLGPKVYYSYDHEGGRTEKDLHKTSLSGPVTENYWLIYAAAMVIIIIIIIIIIKICSAHISTLLGAQGAETK